MNNISYNFTEQEVEAVSKLIATVKEMDNQELNKVATVVATAFNREAFKEIGVLNDKYNPQSDMK